MPPIGQTPTFSYHGSKANLAKWLMGYFPTNINRYAEACAGRANPYFRYVTTKGKTAQSYHLNDLYNGYWLQTLKDYDGDYDFIPNIVNDEVFKYWKNQPESIERILIEPIVCYHSNRYNMNSAANSDVGSNFYSPNFAANWMKKLKLARSLLQPAQITALDWKDFLDVFNPTDRDFIYLDPPYNAPYDEKRTYPNINHKSFLEDIMGRKGMYAISNYANDLYQDMLKDWVCVTKERVSAAKGRQKGHGNGRTKVTEHLWLSPNLVEYLGA